MRSALRDTESNFPQYPQQFGAGSKLNSIDLAYLKDLDLSSTTESPSTLAATNKEVESSTSFEYQENNVIRSPFQREIQRLLESSASKVSLPVSRPSISASTNIAKTVNDVNGSKQTTNIQCAEFDSIQALLGSAIAVNGKHPVGLEAIKEIARNTTNSDSCSM